jgi:nucleoside-diphosphate-sugar epimerase
VSILITGAAGFVMSSLARHLAQEGHDVVAADRLPPDRLLRSALGGLPGSVNFRQVDTTDAAAVRALVEADRPARAVLGAAITAIPADAERARFLETVRVNVDGTLTVLDALRAAGTGRIVVVSSTSVYGARAGTEPIREDEPRNPGTLYELTKWAAEALARRYAALHALDLAAVRLASPFGPFERDTGSRPLLSPMCHWATAAARGDVVRVAGPLAAARDAIYVADVAEAIATVLLAGPLPHDVYNVGWGRATTSAEALAVLARLQPGLRVEHDPDTPSPWAQVSRAPLDPGRLTSDLGWRPRHDLESGLAAYLAWLRATR